MRRGKGIAGLVMAFALTLAMVVGVIPAERAEADVQDVTNEGSPATLTGTVSITVGSITFGDDVCSLGIQSASGTTLEVSAQVKASALSSYESSGITGVSSGEKGTATYDFTYNGTSYSGSFDVTYEYKAASDGVAAQILVYGKSTISAASSDSSSDTSSSSANSDTSTDTDSSTSSSTDTQTASTDSTKSNEAAANEQVAAAENGNSARIGVPASSNVKISSIEAMTDANALAALPALVKTVEDATGQGVLKVMNFEIKATGSGQITINVGSEYAGKIAVVGHYVNGQFTTQQCKVASNGYIYPSFASFSPVTVIVTNQTEQISAIPTTEKKVTTTAPGTGENAIPTILALLVALCGIAVLGRKRNAR